MKTEVIVQRPFFHGTVGQKSKSGMFNATDMVYIGNEKRKELDKEKFNLSQYLKNKSVLEFIEELQFQFPQERIIQVKGKGRSSVTWVHPLLFIDVALSIDPKFKVGVYTWLKDELIKYRNDSGDSYKKMVGSLYERTNDKNRFSKLIQNIAIYIKTELKVEDWNKASEEQLKMRDKIHDNITLLSSVIRDVNQILRVSIENALNK